MSKTEWPTAQRIESLRLQGVVPVSHVSLRMAAGAMLLIFGFVQAEYLFSMLNKLAHSGLSSEEAAEHLASLQFFILVPVLISLFSVLFAGLFQTKFLFKPSLCNPDSKRFSGKIVSKERFQQAALALLLFGVILTVSILVFWRYAREYLSLLNTTPGDIMNYLSSWNAGMVFIISVVFVMLAFVSWLISRIGFMSRHKMSRHELLREGG